MDPQVMSKDGKADRIARTPADLVQFSYEGYVAKADEPAPEQPALPPPAFTIPEHDDATVAPDPTE